MNRSGWKRYWREWIWWLICPVLCVLLWLYTFWGAGAFAGGLSSRELLCAACDACFACGLVLAALFVICQCLRHGAFTTVREEGRKLIHALPRKKKAKKKEEKNEDPSKDANPGFVMRNPSVVCVLFAGVFLLAGGILLVLYMR